MPPKPRYSREEIAAEAFKMIKTDGLNALSARELGKRLGTSSSPIFSLFDSMDEVRSAARELAMQEFKEYVSDFREYTPAFKRIGMMIVSYGIHEPELFKLLFMQEHEESADFRTGMDDLGDMYDVCVELLKAEYGFKQNEAELIFEQLWTLAFGMGAMCAMKVCTLSEEEIGQRLGLSFASLMSFVKSGRLNLVFSDVAHSTDGQYHGMKVNEPPFE